MSFKTDIVFLNDKNKEVIRKSFKTFDNIVFSFTIGMDEDNRSYIGKIVSKKNDKIAKEFFKDKEYICLDVEIKDETLHEVFIPLKDSINSLGESKGYIKIFNKYVPIVTQVVGIKEK